MLQRRELWRARDMGGGQQGRHLEMLEQELKKSQCPRLAEHILRLKVAWGRACKAPNPKHQAA